MPQFCVDSLLIFSRPATQILIPARGAIILCHARDFCCCSPKLIIFRFRKNIIFPKIFSWLEQRAGGVTVGGFQKIPEKFKVSSFQYSQITCSQQYMKRTVEPLSSLSTAPFLLSFLSILLLLIFDFRSDFS